MTIKRPPPPYSTTDPNPPSVLHCHLSTAGSSALPPNIPKAGVCSEIEATAASMTDVEAPASAKNLTNSLQLILDCQADAFDEVKNQLTEINQVLNRMNQRHGDATQCDSGSEVLTPEEHRPQFRQNPTSRWQSRASQCSLLPGQSTPSSIHSQTVIGEEGNPDVLTDDVVCRFDYQEEANLVCDEREDLSGEESAEDERFDRMKSMLEHLIVDGNAAIRSDATTNIEIADTSGMSSAITTKQITAPPQARKSQKYSRIVSSPHRFAQSHPKRIKPPSSAVTPTDSSWLSSRAGSGEYLELNFNCSISRSVNRNTQHHIARKLRIPLVPVAGARQMVRGRDGRIDKAVFSPFSVSGRVMCSREMGIRDKTQHIVILFYWTLLFTLGTLLLDSYLCETAGHQVMALVDNLATSSASRLDNFSPDTLSPNSSVRRKFKPLTGPATQDRNDDLSPSVKPRSRGYSF